MKSVFVIFVAVVLTAALYINGSKNYPSSSAEEPCKWVYTVEGTPVVQVEGHLVDAKAKVPVGNTVTGKTLLRFGLYFSNVVESPTQLDEEAVLSLAIPFNVTILEKGSLRISEEKRGCPEEPKDSPKLE